MRSPRFAYKKEEQSNLEILEMLTKYAFPLSNELVGHGCGQSSDWPLDLSAVGSCLYNPFVSFFYSSPYSPSNTKSSFQRMDGRFMIQWQNIKEWWDVHFTEKEKTGLTEYINLELYSFIQPLYCSLFSFFLSTCRVCQTRAGPSVRSTVIMKCVTLTLLCSSPQPVLRRMRSNEWPLSE